jgi:hypothetical protein
MEITKSNCRELYEQMEKAVRAFQNAIEALRGPATTTQFDEGRMRVEYPACKIRGSTSFLDSLDCDQFLAIADVALEQALNQPMED